MPSADSPAGEVNHLLVGVLNLFGDTRTKYGHDEFNTGAITNLTG